MGPGVRTYRAIGLMSGTSMDGIDVALLETDGDVITRFGPSATHSYQDAESKLLRDAVEAARTLEDRTSRPGIIAEAERAVTALHASAVKDFLDANHVDSKSIDVAGFHGQTLLHRPEKRLTIQIGDGAALARDIGIPVVFDFRAGDVAAGGQGAPLVPIFHRALAAVIKRPRPIAVLNVGGVANVTLIDDQSDPCACDTGPGNALIDDFMRERTGVALDPAGANAAQGRVDDDAVQRVLAHPFFAQKPPKSLDRNDFRTWVAAEGKLDGKSVADGAATLTAITAASVAAIVKLLPSPPQTWIVAGGGAQNDTLLRMLKERLAPAAIETASAVGWNSDALEAQAFAYLAVRHLCGLPITFPTTTGAPHATQGGVLVRP
jgi:anhydro-N-acetylmuramic acid kinase